MCSYHSATLPEMLFLLALVDSFSYFKVSVEAPDIMYPKVCPKIREAIFSGVDAAATALRYNNSKPKPAFLCGKCGIDSPHATIPTNCDEKWYLICTKSTSCYESLTEQHTVWLDVKRPTRDFAAGKHYLSHLPSD